MGGREVDLFFYPNFTGWKKDRGAWMELGQKMEVTKNDSKRQQLFCQMANQISTSESDGINNPFFKKDTVSLVIGGGLGNAK